MTDINIIKSCVISVKGKKERFSAQFHNELYLDCNHLNLKDAYMDCVSLLWHFKELRISWSTSVILSVGLRGFGVQ